MRSLLAGAALLAVTPILTVTACGNPGFPRQVDADRYLHPVVRAYLPTRSASYLGVYEPGEPESLPVVTEFAASIGKMPNLLLLYRTWGLPFPAKLARTALACGVVPVIQLDPVGVPLAAIAAGRDDRYLRSLADQVREFGRPVVLGFAGEMNGHRSAWGLEHVRPATWVGAWRRVVTDFRAAGADNVTWQWTIDALGPVDAGGPEAEAPSRWWPGDSYVDWVGIDGHYDSPSDSFAGVFGKTLAAVRTMTSRPIVISRVTVERRAGLPRQVAGLFAAILQRHLLGLVWSDPSGSRDRRLEDDPHALAGFRRRVRELSYQDSPCGAS